MGDQGKAKSGAGTGPFSFEEYRLMYETTERVVDRKIAMIRSNSSFCSAIIAGQAVAVGWAFGKGTAVELAAGSVVMFISILGVIFCCYWYDQIVGARNLNKAKFRVLDEMAQALRFPDYLTTTEIRSMNPFDREWQIMEADKKLSKLGDRKTNVTERVVPLSFLAFFLVEFVALLAWIIQRAMGFDIL